MAIRFSFFLPSHAATALYKDFRSIRTTQSASSHACMVYRGSVKRTVLPLVRTSKALLPVNPERYRTFGRPDTSEASALCSGSSRAMRWRRLAYSVMESGSACQWFSALQDHDGLARH